MTNENTSQRNKRIAKNTLLLYFRMLITMGVSLYTVRIVLNTLGVEDYGLYNVVGGIVALLAFLPGSMASATQRFFSHALGQQNQDRLNRVFGVNALIYLSIGLLALVVLKTAGDWFVANKLSIPDGRFEAVQTIFDIAVITFVVTILKSPFMAIIIAHEDMVVYAYMAILDALLKLGAVFLLVQLPGDKIIVYAWLLLAVAIIDTLLYQIICFRKYSECQVRHIRWERQLAKEVVGFTAWTLFGQLTSVARGAAVTILLNQYFSPIVIAARAIASNITSQSNILASQFNTSLYPPIIKAYAADQKEEMYSLVINGSKATFFLMWILALPVFVHMEEILTLWLKSVPEYTVAFARLTLIEGLIFAISLPVATAARAPGKMAAYESILGTLQLAALIVSWFLLEARFGPYSVFYAAIVLNLLMFVVRLIIVNYLTGLSVLFYLKKTLLPVIGVVVVTVVLSALVAHISPPGLIYLFIALSGMCIINTVSIYFIGLPVSMRQKLNNFILGRFMVLSASKADRGNV